MISFHLCLTMSVKLTKSKFIRRPSARCPSICDLDFLWTYGMDCFSCWLPRAVLSDCFLIFEKKCFFHFFTNFSSVFVNMAPYGSENFITLILLQIAGEIFQTSSEFSSQQCSQKYVLPTDIFFKSLFPFLTIFFFVFVNTGSNRS